MKALTICQPYASLIVTPPAYLPEGEESKRVENRNWETRYRGPLLIHAGLSRKWLGPDRETAQGVEKHWANSGVPLIYGAAVGVAWLKECLPLEKLQNTPLANHAHAFGPWCWVLDAVRPFSQPVYMSGAQGLWECSEEALSTARVLRLSKDGQVDRTTAAGTVKEWRLWCGEMGLIGRGERRE